MQFSADDIEKLLRKSDLDALVKQTEKARPDSSGGCTLCGKYHVSSYGGQVYCRDLAHFAHGFGWSQPALPPLTEAELDELHAHIVKEKNDKYPGGYTKWCDDRGIPENKR